jgi:eukaryotic-like serine/threonine-protein kinase
MRTALICLDENSALDFLSGRLGAPALAETERHLGVCGACVELLARSAPFLPSRHGEAAAALAHRVSPAVSTLAMHRAARPEPRPPRTMEGNPADGEGQAWSHGGDDGAGDDADGPPPTLAPGTVLKDTYTVLSLIGRGGMGEVYEVAHARLAGRYALKLLPPAFAHEHVSVTRFRREADITSALRHPNIVQVIDFDHTPAGQPFLVMEHLDGGDLAQLMAACGPMPLERVLPIVAQIVSALSAVHRKGIVHRDLKPQNVLLVRDDGPVQDRVKLVDFGLSKRNEPSLFGLGASISRERTLLGTPRYMAPEQASGRIDEIDATTDQFALGAMVYEMLTGVSAFNGEHIALLLYRIVSEEPAPMQSIVPDIPDHVEEAVRRAMSKQRSDRFASTSAFFEAFSGGPTALGEPSGAGTAPLSDRGARATAVGMASRLRTPPGSPQLTATRAARAAAPTVDSMDAMGASATRRRRVTSFVIGVGLATLLAIVIPPLRSWWWPDDGGVNRPSASAPTAPVAAPAGAEAPSPGGTPPTRDPAAAVTRVEPPPSTAVPSTSRQGSASATAVGPDGTLPPDGPGLARARTTSARTSAEADAAHARVRGAPALARRARPATHRGPEAPGTTAPAASSDSPGAKPAEQPPVGRLVEDL